MKLTKTRLAMSNNNWLLCEFKNGERRLVSKLMVEKMKTEKWNACKSGRGQTCNDRYIYENGIPVIPVQNLQRVIRSSWKTESIILVPFPQTKTIENIDDVAHIRNEKG